MEEQIGLVRLGKASSRMANRIDRWTRKLAATKAPTAKAAAMKGAALIEIATVEDRREDPFDALALSIAHDRVHLGLEVECLPEADSDFGKYHREILRLHAEINDGDLTEDEANVRMDRWGAIDRLALSTLATTIPDAVACLAYARREFIQFEMKGGEGDDNPSHRLVLHLLDEALAALSRGEPALGAPIEPAISDSEERATVSQMADLEFEAWDMEGFTPPANAERGGVFAETHLATSRIAWGVCRKTKPELVEMVRSLEESSGEDMLSKLSEDLHGTAAFFGAYQDMAQAAEIRLLSAGATLARQQGEPEAQPGYRKPADAVRVA